jgi:hypothetical protein
LGTADLFRDLHKHVRFFTQETAGSIPPTSGIYAWFLPISSCKDIDRTISLARSFLLFDARAGGLAKLVGRDHKEKVEGTFAGHSVGIQFRASYSPIGNEAKDLNLIERWHEAESCIGAEEMKTLLLQASIFLPPLYIGKSDNLQSRWKDHVTRSSFFKRFSKYSEMLTQNKELDFPFTLSVRDLIFGCILTPDDHSGQESDKKMDAANELLELVLQKIFKPPFSLGI